MSTFINSPALQKETSVDCLSLSYQHVGQANSSHTIPPINCFLEDILPNSSVLVWTCLFFPLEPKLWFLAEALLRSQKGSCGWEVFIAGFKFVNLGLQVCSVLSDLEDTVTRKKDCFGSLMKPALLHHGESMYAK